MNKKVLSGILAACMALTMLFGCAAKPTDSGTSTPDKTSTVASDKPAEKVNLQYTYFAESGTTVDLYTSMCEAFTKANPNITVDFTPIVDDYKTKLIVMIASKTAPDVAWVSEDMVVNYASQNALLPLDGYDGTKFKSDEYLQSNLDGYKYQDKLYALPFDSATGLLFANNDIMKKAGVTLPEDYMTWEQIREVAKKTTLVENGVTSQYGFVIGTGADYLHPFIKAAGGDFIDKDGKTTFNTQPVKDAFTFFNDLMYVDKSMPIYGSQAISFSETFKSGKAGLMFNGSWAVGEVMTQKDFNCSIIRLPKNKNISTQAWTGASGVLSSTKYPEEATDFLTWFCGEEGQTMKFNGKFAASPTMKSLINTELAYKGYEDPAAPDNDFTYLMDSLQYSYILPAAIFSNAEIVDQITKTTEKFFLQTITVDEMAKELDETVTALLK